MTDVLPAILIALASGVVGWLAYRRWTSERDAMTEGERAKEDRFWQGW